MKSNYTPWPLDFAILEIVPDVGTIGGVHWRGRRVRDLAEVLNARPGIDGTLSVSTISARLRSMKAAGLVEPFPGGGSGGAKVWARTQRGAEFAQLNDNKEEQ